MNAFARPVFVVSAALLAALLLGPARPVPASPPPPPARDPAHLTIALVNLRCVTSDDPDPAARRANLDANLKRHLYFIDRAAAQGADLVGFPELSLNGYRFGEAVSWLALDGPEVRALAARAVERGVYVAAGMAEQDAAGKRWNTHFVLGPTGEVVGRHHKIWLTKEQGLVETGTEHGVFEVRGVKVGITTCADGTDRKNLQALVDNGARLIYGPHANTTGGTTAGWYRFRAAWGGPGGWIASMKVHAVLHNHAGLYGGEFDPPAGDESNAGWASGAWFIGPDGQTLAQMPPSDRREDSREFVLMCKVPLAAPR